MRKRLAAALAVATLVLVPSAIAFASYTWTDVDGSTGNWYSMAVSDGGLVAYSSQHRLVGPTVGQGRIWKTVDGGVSWSEIMTSPTYANWPHVATSGSGNVVAGIGFALGSSYTTIQISSDAGTTWSPATAAGNLQWTGVALSQNGSIVYATSKNTTGTDGSVKKSIDGGTTWTNVTPEFGGFLLDGGSWTGVATSSDGSRVFAALEGMGVFVSSNGGTSWTRTMTAPSGTWPAIRASGSGKYVIATKSFADAADRGVWVSTDFGMNWTRTFSSSNATPAAVSRDGSTMAFAVNGGSLYVSRDFGSTWSAEPPADSPWMGIGLSESGERMIAVAEQGLARFATSTTTTTTTTTTTIASSTSESTTSTTATSTSSSSSTVATTVAPAPVTTTVAPAPVTTTATSTTAASTTTVPPTTLPTTTLPPTTTSTIVDSPPPVVTPSMVSTFIPKPLVKEPEVPAGGTFTVRISGFQPFELVSIGFDVPSVQSQEIGEGVRALNARKVLMTVRADATGTIAVETKAPVSTTGAVTLWAYGRESKVGFRQKMTIAALPETGKDSGGLIVNAVALLGVGTLLIASRRRLRRSAMMG